MELKELLTVPAACYMYNKLQKKGASNSVFGRRTSTGSGLFASLGSGLIETLGKIVFISEKKRGNTNLLASRHIKTEKASIPVDVSNI